MIYMSRNFQRIITSAIEKRSSPNSYCKFLLVGKRTFLAFLKEIEPIYKNLYGGLVTSEQYSEYTHVLYAGCAVCLASSKERHAKRRIDALGVQQNG